MADPALKFPALIKATGASRESLMKMLRAGELGEQGTDWWTIRAPQRRGGVEYRFAASVVDRVKQANVTEVEDLELTPGLSAREAARRLQRKLELKRTSSPTR